MKRELDERKYVEGIKTWDNQSGKAFQRTKNLVKTDLVPCLVSKLHGKTNCNIWYHVTVSYPVCDTLSLKIPAALHFSLFPSSSRRLCHTFLTKKLIYLFLGVSCLLPRLCRFTQYTIDIESTTVVE